VTRAPLAGLLLLALGCASDPPPKPAQPAHARALEEEVGEEGGVERSEPGVPGGVAGGKSADPAGSKFLPPNIGAGQLLVDVRDPRYSPTIRPEYRRVGAIYWALFKVCVSPAGQVARVTVLKSTSVKDVDGDWQKTIEGWPHRPYLINGQPVPFCYPLRLELRVPRPPPS
jgi:hypothetical protein